MKMEERLALDYQHTLDQYHLLADIRFKLLGFVSTVSGIAITLLTEQASDQVALPVSILGFLVTLGILFYEIRNSQIYDAAIHRAKYLELLLGLPVSIKGAKKGGLFNERPSRILKLFERFSIWHDRGLILIYGAAIGGWGYFIASALSGLLGYQIPWLAPLIGAVLAIVVAGEIQRLSGKNKPQPVVKDALALAENHNGRLGGLTATLNVQVTRNRE